MLTTRMVVQCVGNNEWFVRSKNHRSGQDDYTAIAPEYDASVVADQDWPFRYNPVTYNARQFRPKIASVAIDSLESKWSEARGVWMELKLRIRQSKD
ncbi:MAG: hypothetical protein OXN84_20310 [Albidovulum sp.]|nr:hypothetical protein [Albidovulum sp.]MDE0532397.1 hypothetical protein [Albidovulum sp.]